MTEPTERDVRLRALALEGVGADWHQIGRDEHDAIRWAVAEIDRLRARVAELEAGPRKVYTVESGGGMNFHGVFSTREEAEGWARARLSTYADVSVDEWEIDTSEPPIRAKDQGERGER